MASTLTIGGQTVTLAWTQDIARRFPYRAASIGGAPTVAQLRSPRTAAAAITKILWLVLPPAGPALYPTPEDLFIALDHENEAEAIHAAVSAIITESQPDPEKKSSSPSTPSPESNSG